MKLCGIIAEFNPFHLGHKVLIDEVKENFDGVIAVISGNIVQRGEFSVIDRRLKTKLALESGVDLVLELPLPFSALSAEKFASRGVFILDSLNIVDSLAFGVQTEQTNLLKKVAHFGNTDLAKELIDEKLKNNISYPVAYENVVKEELGISNPEIFNKGNNILAIEYLSALDKFSSSLKPFFVCRNEDLLSAKKIRQLMLNGENFENYLPDFANDEIKKAIEEGNAPVSVSVSDRSYMAILRNLDINSIKNAPDVVGGLENRIMQAIENSEDFDEVIKKSSSNIFTHSRIKRALVCACLQINKEDAFQMPSYIRALGHNEKGREILKSVQSTCKLPIIMKTSDIKTLPSYSRRIFEINAKGDNLYNIFTPRLRPCNTYYKESVTVI